MGEKMIIIVDGMPGAGKTQFTISKILKQAKKEKRPVYYHNIPELKIDDWTEISNPETWDEIPDGAIIVLDEAQRVFKLRPAGSEKPQRTVALETHRHKGHDLYLITQDGTLLDIQCRKLCNSFYHLKRIAGTSRVSVTEYAEFVNHNDYHERKKAIGSTVYKQEKAIWKLYKSATIHTVQAKIPKKIYGLLALVLVAVSALYSAYARWTGDSPHVENYQSIRSGTSPGHIPDIYKPQIFETPQQQKVAEKLEYFERYRPRIRDKPETAPLYDGLRSVASYPRLQCIKSVNRGCKCYTQQATQIQISEYRCNVIVEKGAEFDEALVDLALIAANAEPKKEDEEIIIDDVPLQEKTVNIINGYKPPKRKLKYSKHDRGSMVIEKVIKTN